ncbi:helix-turn-helix transcriptional regulator [Ramlibacter sp.]|uniref:helix-turn-helix transcriptional regulator n=1 Tax=Ramlibacter sp. TaxID=1917967 RepID=UPI0025DA9BF0|nr:helix-turn-helix transcriptional regulator [Ramlibacter sp.]
MKRTLGAFTMELLPGAAYAARDASHLAALGVALERQRGVHAVGSDRRTDFDTWAGTASLTPPGVDVYSASDAGGEYLVVRWAAGADDAQLPPQRVQRAAQAALLKQAFRVRAAMLCTDAQDDAPLDAAVQALLSLGADLLPTERALHDAWHLQARYAPVLQCIEDGLADGVETLSLACLAAHVNESPLRFLRGFRQATGMTPHAYIAERRLQRARQLVRDWHLPLADVAIDCGYASQSHMGHAFAKHLGISPARYRARLHPS